MVMFEIKNQISKNKARLNYIKSLQRPGMITNNANEVASEIEDLEHAIELLKEHIDKGKVE